MVTWEGNRTTLARGLATGSTERPAPATRCTDALHACEGGSPSNTAQELVHARAVRALARARRANHQLPEHGPGLELRSSTQACNEGLGVTPQGTGSGLGPRAVKRRDAEEIWPRSVSDLLCSLVNRRCLHQERQVRTWRLDSPAAGKARAASWPSPS